jgi:hypothetical protein
MSTVITPTGVPAMMSPSPSHHALPEKRAPIVAAVGASAGSRATVDVAIELAATSRRRSCSSTSAAARPAFSAHRCTSDA